MSPSREYALPLIAVAACTAACFALFPLLTLTDLVMVYLVGALIVSLRGHRGPALLSALLAVLAFDFFFVPPRFTFHVEHQQYVVTFVVMFGVVLLINHLAVRIRRQAEAAKRAEVVAATEKLRSSLLSAVSHELRSPLTAILGSASALLRGQKGDAGLIENIRDEAERLSRLVHNLIETTRLESGAALRKEPYSLEDVIGTALERCDKPLAGRRVEADLPANLPLVPLDPLLMELVFVNLLENAAAHAPKASVEITARERMELIEVSVADDGPGLKDEDTERVFEKFYRASAVPGGAGLGLAICKAVIEAHGGTIKAENRPGGGAVFRFTLPRGKT
jgi:two-component system, OmpR family, sensor histidine kinase KdpD